MIPKNTPILLLCLLLLAGCSNPTEGGKDGTPNASAILNTAKGLQLLGSFKIEKGSFLEERNSEDWDYPSDFQLFKNQLWILSAYERKLLSYDLNTNQFAANKIIDDVLAKERNSHNPELSSAPSFIRFTENFVIVGYDFKMLIFDGSQHYSDRIAYKSRFHYITTTEGDNVFVWFQDSVVKLNLTNRETVIYSYSERENYHGLVDFIAGAGNEVANEGYLSRVTDTEVAVSAIDKNVQEGYPEFRSEHSLLLHITEQYFVSYSFKIGDSLLLVDKKSGAKKLVNLGFDIGKNLLSDAQDRSNGMRITGDDHTLYFLVMKMEGTDKNIYIYKLGMSDVS